MFSRLAIFNFKKVYERLLDGQNSYEETGEKILSEIKETISKATDSFLHGNKMIIDAECLQRDWFPYVDCDIFISHSHDDSRQVICFVGWLYETFGIKAFVDSVAWNYVNDLSDKLYKKYLKLNGGERSPSKDLLHHLAITSSETILRDAIEEMIDISECFLFIGTKNSLKGKKTESPWLFFENKASNRIRLRPLIYYRKSYFRSLSVCYKFSILRVPKIRYSCNFEEFTTITLGDLREWKKCQTPVFLPEQSLDYLYKMKGIYQ